MPRLAKDSSARGEGSADVRLPAPAWLRELAGQIDGDRPVRQLDLVIAYEEDVETIADFQARQDIAGLMKWLERGRKHKAGDCQPPTPLRAGSKPPS